ncbi:MAG: Gfo/Idh/MocA family oxidoreductase [Pirellulales bacterium]|nr:Gfo/Idh/MocA family oxidoreductase [Pirellulales bacterium]
MKHAVALCDVDQAVLAEAAKKVEASNGACRTYSDYRRLLDDPEIDAVVITTPDHWHAQMTIDACRAGKDVYCEKPLTLTVAEGRKMVAAARQTGRIVQTGSQQRSDELFQLACTLVRAGKIGRVERVEVGISKVNFDGQPVPDGPVPPELDYDFWLGPAPWRPYNVNRVHYKFRFFWDYSGGQMTNWGAHHLDITQWALGRDGSGPVEASGTAKYHPEGWYEVPMDQRATLRYDDGVVVDVGMHLPGGAKFIGADGWIQVDRKRLVTHPAELAEIRLADLSPVLPTSRDHHQNWLDCLRTRELPICDVEIGHRSATVCHLANIATRLERTIAWDPASERIVGDDDAAAMLARPYRGPWSLG